MVSRLFTDTPAPTRYVLHGTLCETGSLWGEWLIKDTLTGEILDSELCLDRDEAERACTLMNAANARAQGQPCDKCSVYVPMDEYTGADKPDGTTEYLCPDCPTDYPEQDLS